MSIENFLMKNVEATEKVEVYLSERFKAPFIIRAISEEVLLIACPEFPLESALP